jgi:phenylalanyl-tRNA synthetase beta chain
MGGATSEISDATSEVLLEAAFFDPMTIARSSKRHGLRSEASNRFERGVDPNLALRAAARFVALLRESVPDLEWLRDPLDEWGTVPAPPTIEIRHRDIEALLGVDITSAEATTILEGLNFTVLTDGDALTVTAPSARLDVRTGRAGRADVIEEIARLHGYRRLPRRTPTWPEPGKLTARQQLRRRVRDVVVDLGAFEVWTPTLGSDEEFDLVHPGVARVRITNPLAFEESVMRATMLTGLVRAWGRNVERGTGDVVMAEIGAVFAHPSTTSSPRRTRGGNGGTVKLELPSERERVTVLLGRQDDDASTAVAMWSILAERLGLDDVVVRTPADVPRGLHPTRCGALVDRASGAIIGYVGEIDATLVQVLVPSATNRRVGVVDLDLEVLADPTMATRRSGVALMPSRYPSASIDLALVTPSSVHAADLAYALESASEMVEGVTLFDVYRGSNLPDATRSLAFTIRFSAPDRTLNESEVARNRELLIETARTLGAVLRGSA